MTAVAEKAGLSSGLLHHHFKNKNEMLDELFNHLVDSFKNRLSEFALRNPGKPLESYIDAALKLDQSSDIVAARCWVGLLAEALRNPTLYSRVKRHLDVEVRAVLNISNGTIDEHQSSSLIAFVFGALLFGAFAPKKAVGFAVPAAKRLVRN